MLWCKEAKEKHGSPSTPPTASTVPCPTSLLTAPLEMLVPCNSLYTLAALHYSKTSCPQHCSTCISPCSLSVSWDTFSCYICTCSGYTQGSVAAPSLVASIPVPASPYFHGSSLLHWGSLIWLVCILPICLPHASTNEDS